MNLTRVHIYNQKNADDTIRKTESYLSKNPEKLSEYEKYYWCLHSIGRIIPMTTENFFSGHFFPYTECMDELQISANLAMQGLYKQAFVSLRSTLELGLLSVYYNINDLGHVTVQDWLRTKNAWDNNTPRTKKIWRILLENENIKQWNDIFNIKSKFDELSYLHNYVHTKGYKYSNHLGKLKGNFQTFEEDILISWLNSVKEVITLIITLHILKYPISVIKFDWSKKTGFENPFPVLEIGHIEQLEEIFNKDEFEVFMLIASKDYDTQGLFSYIKNLPDLTEEELEEKHFDWDKCSLETTDSYASWKSMQLYFFENSSHIQRIKTLRRMRRVRKWAVENGKLK